MKLYLAENFNNTAVDLLGSIVWEKWEVVSDFLEADKIVLWNEAEEDARMFILLAQKKGKKVITIQHGRYGTNKYYPPYNYLILSDKLCVWGVRDKRMLVKAGHPANKIEVVGASIFKYLKPRQKHDGINIVYSPEHWTNEIKENKKVAEELRKLDGVNIITKLLKGEHNISWYDNPVISGRKEMGHLEICAGVLSKADIVVGISEGTFELMAQYLDIPVVIMNEWNPKPYATDPIYLTYKRVISEASKKTNLKNLCNIVRHQLANSQELKKEREIVALEEGGCKIDTIKEIMRIIKNA